MFIWVGFFGVSFPISLMARKLLGSDSENMYTWPEKYFFSGTMMIFFSMLQPLTLAAFAEVSQGRTANSDYEYASYSLSCLVLAIISTSILNSLVLVLRHYRMSDHPMIQLRFNVLFTAQRCSEHTLAPHLFMPLTLAIKFFQVYALYYAPTPLLLHQYLTVLILSIIVRPFLRTYNLLYIVIALPGNSATLQIPTDSSHDSSV